HTDSLVRPQIVENQRFVNLHRHHLVRPQVRAAQPLQVAQLAGAQTIAVPLEEEIHDRLPGREEEVEGEPFQERGLTLLEPRAPNTRRADPAGRPPARTSRPCPRVSTPRK